MFALAGEGGGGFILSLLEDSNPMSQFVDIGVVVVARNLIAHATISRYGVDVRALPSRTSASIVASDVR